MLTRVEETAERWREANAQFCQIVGGKVKLDLHPKQKAIWESPKRFLVFLAGYQAGKTCLLAHWLKREIDRTYNPKDAFNDYLVGTPSYPLLEKKLLKEFQIVFEGIHKLGAYKAGVKRIEFHQSNVRIHFGSADNPESLESATVKGVVLDEVGQNQFPKASWDAVLGRASIHQARILCATTLYNWGWLKRELYDKWKAGDSHIEVVQCASIENPRFPREEWERAKAALPDWQFKMRYEGVFDKPAGLVYDSFDSERGIILRFPILEGWPRYSGHDFGGVNTAALFATVNPDTSDIYYYNEYLPRQSRSLADHVASFKEKQQGGRILKSLGGAHQEEQIREGFKSEGWKIEEPKILNVQAGIDHVYGLHRKNRIYVFSDLVEYLDEKQSYSYKVDTDYTAKDEIESKSRYHLMDCERALCSMFKSERIQIGEAPKTQYASGWRK